MSFNPLPSPKQGETKQTPDIILDILAFQSAPLTEARGDPERSLACVHSMFQSAPLTEARGDEKIMPTLLDTFVFQSAPLTEARGDS